MNSAQPCPFCSPKPGDIVCRTTLWYARWDAFPATKGHLLIIPIRHCPGYFDTTKNEQASLPEMLFVCRKILDEKFSPAGYSIVANTGAAADQRVMHCHIHLIPRYTQSGDNPPGGIRSMVMEQEERVI